MNNKYYRNIKLYLPLFFSLLSCLVIIYYKSLIQDLTHNYNYFWLDNEITYAEGNKFLKEDSNLPISFFFIDNDCVVTNRISNKTYNIQKIEVLGELGCLDIGLTDYIFYSDKDCIISENVAEILFGHKDVKNLYIYIDNIEYRIAYVSSTVTDTIITSPKDQKNTYNFIAINKKVNVNNINFTYQEIDINLLLISIDMILLLIFIVIIYTISTYNLFINNKTSRMTKTLLFTCIIFIGCFLIFKDTYIPNNWIPSRWSNMEHWINLIDQVKTNIINYFKLQIPNILIKPFLIFIKIFFTSIFCLYFLQKFSITKIKLLIDNSELSINHDTVQEHEDIIPLNTKELCTEEEQK